MWKVIENSYFWLVFSRKQREFLFRFKHPLSSKVTVFQLNLHIQKINLINDEEER